MNPIHSKGTALVTGGAKRLGQHMALQLARWGYAIALHYNASQKDAQQAQELIKQEGGVCELFACDLTHKDASVQLFNQITPRLPQMKVLINNASVFKASGLKPEHLEDLQRDLQVHVTAPFSLSAQFARHSPEGHIINILDTHITRNKSEQATYLLAKKALAELTKMTALAYAPSIRVNAIAPGLILPPEGKRDDYLDRLAQHIPLRRKGAPEHVIKALQFLLENDFLTGQTIFVDGGEHLT